MKKILILLFICFEIYAQKVYSLEECIETALKQSQEIQLQNLNILQASENYKYSKKNKFPSVSANISQGINGGRSIDPFSNNFVQRSISSNSYGVGANWNIFNGFSVQNQIEINKNEVEGQKQQMVLDKKELKINVILAFMQVLVAQELLKISQEQKRDLESQLTALNEKVKEGLLPKSQISDFEAQIANVSFEEYSAKNNLELAKLNLAQWLGFTSKSNFDIKYQRKLNQKYLETSFIHPSQKILENKLIGAKLNSKIAKASKYPMLSLSGGLGSAYSSAAASEFSYFNQLNYNLNQYFRIGLNIPIYSNGQVLAKISNASIQEQIIKKQIDQQKLKIGQEYEKQKMEIALLSEKLKYAETNLKAQNNSYQSGKERFEEGVLNSIELNTLRLNAEKSKITQIQTQIELDFKSLILETFLE
ncbi:MAG: TolC family protein [Leadbetterella sp.]|nr:TolC family protein [Leadbetterella sp.]